VLRGYVHANLEFRVSFSLEQGPNFIVVLYSVILIIVIPSNKERVGVLALLDYLSRELSFGSQAKFCFVPEKAFNPAPIN
jgi:hypothetical protein